MEYTLKINETGKLDGWQEVKYTLNNVNVVECQKFYNGVYQEWSAFVMVFKDGASYYFNAEDWGKIETARDAAELFAVDGDLNCVYKNDDNIKRVTVVPMTEEAFV